MPHRDPETGQFVSGSDHAGAIANADAVLRHEHSVNVGDGAVNSTDFEPPDRVDSYDSLEFQKDYRILGLQAVMNARPYNTDVGTNTPDSDLAEQVVRWQLATTSTYAETPAASAGAQQPVGVLYEHHTKAATDVVWDDGTYAGVRPGYLEKNAEFIPAEKMINCDVTPDAGTAVNLHLDITGKVENAESTQHWAEFRWYVQERSGSTGD